MSADNWTTCPRCFDRARATADEEKEKVMGLYGTIPVDEFDIARDSLVEPRSADFVTFREDYEFSGADEGVVYADYRGACTSCGLSVEIKESKKFWPDERDR